MPCLTNEWIVLEPVSLQREESFATRPRVAVDAVLLALQWFLSVGRGQESHGAGHRRDGSEAIAGFRRSGPDAELQSVDGRGRFSAAANHHATAKSGRVVHLHDRNGSRRAWDFRFHPCRSIEDDTLLFHGPGRSRRPSDECRFLVVPHFWRRSPYAAQGNHVLADAWRAGTALDDFP